MHDKSAGFDREAGSQNPRRTSVPAGRAAPSAVVSAAEQDREFLTGRQSAALLGLSERRWEQVRRESWMPLPVELGQRGLRWIRSELVDAVKHFAPRRSVQQEPAHLTAARDAARWLDELMSKGPLPDHTTLQRLAGEAGLPWHAVRTAKARLEPA